MIVSLVLSQKVNDMPLIVCIYMFCMPVCSTMPLICNICSVCLWIWILQNSSLCVCVIFVSLSPVRSLSFYFILIYENSLPRATEIEQPHLVFMNLHRNSNVWFKQSQINLIESHLTDSIGTSKIEKELEKLEIFALTLQQPEKPID